MSSKALKPIDHGTDRQVPVPVVDVERTEIGSQGVGRALLTLAAGLQSNAVRDADDLSVSFESFAEGTRTSTRFSLRAYRHKPKD